MKTFLRGATLLFAFSLTTIDVRICAAAPQATSAKSSIQIAQSIDDEPVVVSTVAETADSDEDRMLSRAFAAESVTAVSVEIASNNIAKRLNETRATNTRESSATSETAKVNPTKAKTNSPSAPSSAATTATSVYHVGDGDVLDMRVHNREVASNATLYTIASGGMLNHELVGESIVITGLTTDDVAALLTTEFKRRAVFDDPKVDVEVHKYVSHKVMVTGLVRYPGKKILRREALPLYVLLAEAQLAAGANRVIIASPNHLERRTIKLNDVTALETLVRPGELVHVVAAP